MPVNENTSSQIATCHIAKGNINFTSEVKSGYHTSKIKKRRFDHETL